VQWQEAIPRSVPYAVGGHKSLNHRGIIPLHNGQGLPRRSEGVVIHDRRRASRRSSADSND
jgi:hypothetical protein